MTPVPELKPDLPVVPKPLIKTGVFTPPMEVAKAAPAPQKAVIGGFGDPNAVHPSDQLRPAPVMLAKVGSFDLPNGGGETGGGGRSQNGGIKQGGFGSVGDSSGVLGGTGNGGNSAVKPADLVNQTAYPVVLAVGPVVLFKAAASAILRRLAPRPAPRSTDGRAYHPSRDFIQAPAYLHGRGEELAPRRPSFNRGGIYVLRFGSGTTSGARIGPRT